MAKEIQEVQIWVNGSFEIGNYIDASIVNDNLHDYAQFLWEISKVTGTGENAIKQILSRGNVTINDADYIQWGQSGDINYSAYQFICSKLNLTLIP